MVRRLCLVAALALTVAAAAPAEESRVTLLTVAQRDRIRSRSNAASVSISADGRYIAFASYERLVPADVDSLADIYILDRSTGAISLESATADGVAIVADCLYPHISGTGRYLVFEGASLVSPQGYAFAEVIFRDRTADLTRRIARSVSGERPDGWSGGAVVSDDGMSVAFVSSATNLVPGVDANGIRPDVYLIQRDSGRIARVNLDALGQQPADGWSSGPTISGDGRFVAFVSTAQLAVSSPAPAAPRRGNLAPHVYLRDTQRNLTTQVDRTRSGTSANEQSQRAVISRDGSAIAFGSSATNLAPNDQNRLPDVFLFERQTESITLISRTLAGKAGNGASGYPSLSADGRFVAFQSEASDLVCSRCPDGDDINLLSDVFLVDRATGATTWVSTGASGGWIEESTAPVLDGSGRVVAFTSRHPTDDGDVGHDFDLFVRVPADPR